MKRNARRLAVRIALEKETIRKLADSGLEIARGGWGAPPLPKCTINITVAKN